MVIYNLLHKKLESVPRTCWALLHASRGLSGVVAGSDQNQKLCPGPLTLRVYKEYAIQ